jgi:hypothetical protein
VIQIAEQVANAEGGSGRQYLSGQLHLLLCVVALIVGYHLGWATYGALRPNAKLTDDEERAKDNRIGTRG